MCTWLAPLRLPATPNQYTPPPPQQLYTSHPTQLRTRTLPTSTRASVRYATLTVACSKLLLCVSVPAQDSQATYLFIQGSVKCEYLGKVGPGLHAGCPHLRPQAQHCNEDALMKAQTRH
jgi:hypothetical protein